MQVIIFSPGYKTGNSIKVLSRYLLTPPSVIKPSSPSITKGVFAAILITTIPHTVINELCSGKVTISLYLQGVVD